MRQFSQKGFRIEQLSFEAKLIYSSFLFFALAAMVVSVLYYGALVGNRPFQGARQYYGQENSVSIAKAPTNVTGPVLEFPEDMDMHLPSTQGPMLLSVSRRKLLEVTHFHLFTLPIFLLVIAHIFMLCSMRPALKGGVLLSSIASSGIHMLAPWLVFWGGASWAFLMPITGAWMTISMLVLILWPAWAMWRSPPTKRRSQP